MNTSKVIWSEGIFLSPQHFQQQDRYIESKLNGITKFSRSHFYGFWDLGFDSSLFEQGIFRVNKATAIFHDGTLINLNERELANLQVTIPQNTKPTVLYLTIPNSTVGVNEVSFDDEYSIHARYQGFEKNISDSTNINAESRTLMLAVLNPRLILENDLTGNQLRLPIAIVSTDNNQRISIERSYIPPTLSSQNETHLKSYIFEVYGLLNQKSKSLAQGVNDPNRGGSVEIMDFLMLQTVNRYLAYLQHEQDGAQHTHPEDLFVNLSKLCADLMTFLPSRKMGDMPIYNHNDLKTCFAQLMSNLRLSLSTVLEQRIIRIPLEKRDEATHIAQTPNKTLLDIANFILAVKADMPNELLRQKIPSTMKISTVEKIHDLIAYHLPGIKLNALSVAPRELPYHNGYIYFELEKQTELWQLFNDTSGMAFHLAGEFPSIDLEFWAIKPNV